MKSYLVASTKKSSGKTIITTGLCSAIKSNHNSISVFKKGPDYIDPLWLSRAVKSNCYNLDFYTMSHHEILQLFKTSSQNSSITITEGNKGLFDGLSLNGSDSNASLAKLLKLEVILVIDCIGITRGIAPLLNGYENFDKKVIKEISKITRLPFKPASNKFAALAAHDEIVNFSGTLNTAAVCLMKIANDIRFLGSGPRAGYGELILPSNEPGSSIMPGKINPTQSEAVTMVCVKVIGNHNGITMAGSHGHFELNVFKPLIIHNILQSIEIMSDSSKTFAMYCVKGIKADKKRIKHLLDSSLMLVTALAPKIGYDKAAFIAKTAYKNGTTLKHEVLKAGLIKESEYEKIMSPIKMIKPK